MVASAARRQSGETEDDAAEVKEIIEEVETRKISGGEVLSGQKASSPVKKRIRKKEKNLV